MANVSLSIAWTLQRLDCTGSVRSGGLNRPGLWRRYGPYMLSLPAMPTCQVQCSHGSTCILPILTCGNLCCCGGCPARCTTRPIISSIDVCASRWTWTGRGQKTMVHVVLKLAAVAARWSGFAGLGLKRDVIDEGTLFSQTILTAWPAQ